MTWYVARRLGLFVVGLVLTSVVVFAALRVLPGDAAQVMGGVRATPEQVGAIREAYGLDRPVAVQYADWVGGLARGDLGGSWLTGADVSAELNEKMQVTAPLAALGLLVALLLGVPAGLLSALHDGRRWAGAAGTAAQAVAAVPVLWAGLLLVLVLGRGVGLLPLLPSQGFPRDGWASPADALRALILPAVTIGVVEGAVVLRFVRAAVLQAAAGHHVRTAAATGLTLRRAVLRHAVPHASLSVLTVVALQAAALLSGVVVVEQLFALPGVGRMLAADVGRRDLVAVQGVVMALTAVVLVVGLLVDVALRLVDPRLRKPVTA